MRDIEIDTNKTTRYSCFSRKKVKKFVDHREQKIEKYLVKIEILLIVIGAMETIQKRLQKDS